MGLNGFTCDATSLVEEVQRLRGEREVTKRTARTTRRRQALSREQRQLVLAKTGGRCHTCGGMIEGAWQADHVLAHSGGGRHAVDNYLPAHHLCNNYRWDYLAAEFQLILKLGVWARTQIERETSIGVTLAGGFARGEKRRVSRQKRTY